ncbi:MAG: hypothetical protein NZ611_05655 [Bacteroidia bacterium]|nr:hypothetical protein [Bacteroidia bacterium]
MQKSFAIAIYGLACLWAQNFGIGTTAPTERLDVEGGRLRVRAYSGAGTRVATVDPNGVFGTLAGNLPGDILQWNGTAWVSAAPPNTTVSTASPLQGNGTTQPITFAPGTAPGQTWQWNGSQWVLAPIIASVTTQAPLQGDGVTTPITFQNGVNPGEVWEWNGVAWQLAPNRTSVVTAPPLQGTGLSASPLTFAPGTADGQVWEWDAPTSQWILAPNSNAVSTSFPLIGNGSTVPITFSPGTADGQVWRWNAATNQWELAVISTTVSTASPLQGDGVNTPITFLPGTVDGQLWQWSGGAWTLNTLQTEAPILGNGLATDRLRLQAGNSNGDILQWDGGSWQIRPLAVQAPLVGTGRPADPIRLQAGGANPQILLWNPGANAWQLTNLTAQNGLTFNLGVPALELGGPLLRNTDINLSGFNLTLSGAAGYVGIGTANPTERLHVEGNLRLQGAFMPNNNAGTTGSLLVSAGAGTPPAWLAPGAAGTILTSQGPGSNPIWQAPPSPYCAGALTNRLVKFSSATQTCNTTLAENASNQIWNQGDGPANPFPGDKFSITASAANTWAINGYASVGVVGGFIAGAAVYGENSSPTGTAFMGGGSGIAPLALNTGSGGAFTGNQYGLFAYAASPVGDRAAGFFVAAPNNVWFVGAVLGGFPAKITGPGAVSTLVSTPDGGFRNRVMFAPEAPEVLIMDFGKGRLVNGQAYISLDPIFSHNIIVDDKHDLRVYIQLEEDCEGVYVTNKSAQGFEVRELRGGRSNASFSWFVVANRKDEVDPTTGEVVARYQDVRFPPAPTFPKILPVSKPRSGPATNK